MPLGPNDRRVAEVVLSLPSPACVNAPVLSTRIALLQPKQQTDRSFKAPRE